MSNTTKSFEDTWTQCQKNGVFALGKYKRVLIKCQDELSTLRNPAKRKLMEGRINYIKMQRLMNESP